ncbi:hypothetical protein U8V72_18090 [Priestia filamentosa]|uniref:hypothetical protein n=1 Tax=Priestia filamentosa TaxID=1402861 RepID=UPI0039796DA4
MNPKYTFLLALLSYCAGLAMYIIPEQSTLFYIMGIFLYINVFTMFHPITFHYGGMRPLQIGLSSVVIMHLLTGKIELFIVALALLVSLIFIEREDVYLLNESSHTLKDSLGLTIKRFIAAVFMPFSVTYVVLIFRPYEEITAMLIVLLYFSALFVASKWFNSIVSFGVFMLIQILLFVYVIELYFSWNSEQITLFFVAILLFLFIGYARKGLLNYANNNKSR